MMQGQQEVKKPEVNEEIDLKKLEKLLIQSEESIKNAAEKDIVLVIGRTGSGKSTLINYLLDGDMVLAIDEKTGTPLVYNTIANSDPNRFPIIGHDLSETSFPRTYHHEKCSFSLCDTAGFGDTRGKIEDICAYFSLSIAARAAKKVKAIILAVDEKGLDLDKGQPFWDVLEIIQKIIGDERLYKNNVFFVFTKGTRTQTQIIAKLEQQTDALFKQDGLGNPRCRDAYAMMTLMLKYKNNIFKIDPLDKGKSGLGLINAVQNANPTNIRKYLRVISDQKEHESIKNVIFSLAVKFNQAHTQILEGQQTIKKAEDNIENYQKQIEANQQEMKKLQEVKANVQDGLNSLNLQLSRLQTRQQNLETTINNDNQAIKLLKSNLLALENDTTNFILYQASFNEKVVYGTVPKGTINTHTFTYTVEDNGAPICSTEYKGVNAKIITEGENERFEKHQKGREKCTIIYFTPSHKYGSATVTLYSEKRFSPENKIKISAVQKLLDDKIIEMQHNEFEKANVTQQIDKIIEHDGLLRGQTELYKQKEDLINKLAALIPFYQEERQRYEKLKKETGEKVETAKNILLEKHDYFQMVMRLRKFYPSELTAEFSKNYLLRYPEESEIIKGYSFNLEADDDTELDELLNANIMDSDNNNTPAQASVSTIITAARTTDIVFSNSSLNTQNHNLDLKKVLKLLREAQKAAKAAAKKEIILIIGKSGAGKSTLINYLNGGKLEFKENDEGDTYVTNQSNPNVLSFPEIGHFGSTTQYPAIYSSSSHPYIFCDTAGFFDTRSLEHTIVNEFALRMVIKSAKSIKATIVVIDEKDLSYEKMNAFKALLHIVSHLFNDSLSFQHSVKFVFNKGQKNIKQISATIAKELKQAQDANQQTLSEATLILQLLAQQQNVMVVNFKNEDSQKQLFDFFEKSPLIPLERFRLNSKSQSVKEIKNIMTDIANSFLKFQDRISMHTDSLRKLNSELISIESNIEDKKNILAKVNEGDIEAFKQYIETQIIKEKESEQKLIEEIEKENDLMKTVTDTLNHLKKNETPLLQWSESFPDIKSKWKIVQTGITIKNLFVGAKKHSFKCELPNNMRILKYRMYDGDGDENNPVGEFFIKDESPSSMEVIYTVPEKANVIFKEACLDVYIKTNESADSRYLIHLKEAQITSLNTSLAELNKKIATIEKRIETLEQQKRGVVHDDNQLASFQNTLISFIQQLTDKKAETQSAIQQCQDSINKAIISIDQKRPNYKMILRLARFIEPDEILRQFLTEYPKYRQAAKKNLSEQDILQRKRSDKKLKKKLQKAETQYKEQLFNLEQKYREQIEKLQEQLKNAPTSPPPISSAIGSQINAKTYPLPILPPPADLDLPLPSEEIITQFLQAQALKNEQKISGQFNYEIEQVQNTVENKEVSQQELKEIAAVRDQDRKEGKQEADMKVDTHRCVSQTDVKIAHSQQIDYGKHLESIRAGVKLKPIKENIPAGKIQKKLDESKTLASVLGAAMDKRRQRITDSDSESGNAEQNTGWEEGSDKNNTSQTPVLSNSSNSFVANIGEKTNSDNDKNSNSNSDTREENLSLQHAIQNSLEPGQSTNNFNASKK